MLLKAFLLEEKDEINWLKLEGTGARRCGVLLTTFIAHKHPNNRIKPL